MDVALAGPVAAIVFDDPGTADISALLEGLIDTDFSRDNLAALTERRQIPENWRAGEALAESFLVSGRSCEFPWPDGRDERRRGSSLPGADLVGFQQDGEDTRFAFGEVKTSREMVYPPSAVYGRHGLKQQLEDLKEKREIRDGLILYLAHRAVNASWQGRFRSAAAVYLRDTCDVRIFGILVRDVPPHEDDLRVRVERLGISCPQAMRIELIAVYLPSGRIETLATEVMRIRETGGAL